MLIALQSVVFVVHTVSSCYLSLYWTVGRLWERTGKMVIQYWKSPGNFYQ